MLFKLFTILILLHSYTLASDRYAAAHSHFAKQADSSGTVWLLGAIFFGFFVIWLAFGMQKQPKSRR